METQQRAVMETVPVKPANFDIQSYFAELQAKCAGVLKESLDGKNAGSVARSHQFGAELAAWAQVLENRGEAYLIRVAALEYEFALLALTLGQHRQAFKGLRLVLELCLQAAYLSGNELQLREWLDNRADTVWNSIVDAENGVLSKRFAKAFFPELEEHVQHFCGLARKLYRECSECVHGNTPKNIPLPVVLGFDQATFDMWHSKADLVAFVAHFAFAMRYLKDLEEKNISGMESFLSDRVGTLTGIRAVLGGPVTA